MLTEAELRQIVAAGETGSVEFKIRPPRPAELAERICGMANTRTGGIILFGIEDRTGKAVGITRPGDITDDILRAVRLVKPPVQLAASDPEVFTLDDANIVAIQIPPNNGTLYQASGVFWIRKGTYTLPMSSEEVEQHLKTSGATGWETTICPKAVMEDLDTNLVERYLSYRAERSRRNLRHISEEDLLVGLDCAVPDSKTGQLRPTNAGILMFGYDPQLFLPQTEVVCIRYEDNLGVGKYLDRKNITGNLSELIDKVEEFFSLNVRVGAKITGFKREDLPEYPLEALREAVVNAIVHRDYSRVGETVRIFYYADRVEIHSPGLLLPGITPHDLAEMKVPSRPRNPVIARLLRDIPGYMERVGSGIRLMVREMRRAGLPDPEFVEQHEFVVIFRNNRETEFDTPKELNSRQLAGFKIIQEKGSISSGEYRTATGASEITAYRDLADMVSKGILTTKGKKKGLRYYLP